ncbi:cytochrome o ubiquinol oxidase subunit IV [Herbaspirillum huttiense]|uniref:cytochrome o ubiquinol oxidase subunit IV n=1 Tax=Herbaspirillum TaxID=963 RepID=UPI000584D4CE|nr:MULTISPECIES: cytochrome o ubiquinol oxidase subunit IV [Herbaspirillum]MAF01453.1 cytochrome o ubiquinol oxidase subunit IV [Herbaspirillum sp.]MBN9356892.1 cytochrome o ubiquinol oxidase subunit IV [Herbaspirillum huttiense]MBO15213.1 cytochrome o ubiquinol oxidase subunit IV [Herbaspirillum sp.]MCP3653765.1 cytochrome o ubiquinol oxidase subunit IV [Herbaspirillum sp.]MCP3947857.1 cytochrome o ubiquinol oxidase subunit IV [Herbaspirillum sp.]
MSRGHQEHPARPMGHQDDHGHGHGHGDHAAHGTMKDYVTGFVLAVILTAIPFWMVMNKTIANPATLGIVLLVFAAVQIVVHIKYFLHMNSKSEGGWNMLAMIFTVVIVVIALSGSLWVMYHLNHNMMPTMSPENMPTETVPQSMQGMQGMQHGAAPSK